MSMHVHGMVSLGMRLVHGEYVVKAGGMVAGYSIQIHTDPVQAL